MQRGRGDGVYFDVSKFAETERKLMLNTNETTLHLGAFCTTKIGQRTLTGSIAAGKVNLVMADLE